MKRYRRIYHHKYHINAVLHRVKFSVEIRQTIFLKINNGLDKFPIKHLDPLKPYVMKNIENSRR